MLPCSAFQTSFVGKERDGDCARMWPVAERHCAGKAGPDRPDDPSHNRARRCSKHVALLATRHADKDNCSDADTHGVSDPSGQARGNFGRAQRGRSRHGFPSPHRQRHLQWAAKSAAHSRALARSRTNFLRRNWLQRSAEALALMRPQASGRPSVRAGGRPQSSTSAPRSSSAVGLQATSTRGERWRYCRESSPHSTRPWPRSRASAIVFEPAIQSVFAGSSSHCL